MNSLRNIALLGLLSAGLGTMGHEVRLTRPRRDDFDFVPDFRPSGPCRQPVMQTDAVLPVFDKPKGKRAMRRARGKAKSVRIPPVEGEE